MTAAHDDTARRRPSQARSAATYSAILAAARAAVEDDEMPTARTIARRAGIAAPTVYRYFADVDALLDALVNEHAHAAESVVAATLDGNDATSLEALFTAVVRAYLDLYARRPELTRQWTSPTLAERQRVIEQRSDHRLAGLLADAAVRRGFAAQPATATSRALLQRRFAVHWDMAGVAIASVLTSTTRGERQQAEADLWLLVSHTARSLGA